MTVRLSVLDQSPMNAHAFDDMEGFPRQVVEVIGWLDRTLPEDHPYATVQAMPSGLRSPEVWLLDSSDYSGTPDKVKVRLLEIADAYAADELMVVTITGDYASRLRSYELLAAEFGLDASGRKVA